MLKNMKDILASIFPGQISGATFTENGIVGMNEADTQRWFELLRACGFAVRFSKETPELPAICEVA